MPTCVIMSDAAGVTTGVIAIAITASQSRLS